MNLLYVSLLSLMRILENKSLLQVTWCNLLTFFNRAWSEVGELPGYDGT
ncbi:MAG: hypothetical protein ACR5K4_01360 [Sodalis sp. (in: enterobacteria)]